MDRREFLKTTGAAAAAAVAADRAEARVASPAVVAGVRELRMATAWPDGVAGFADQAFRLARRIEAASGGRYRIHIDDGARPDAGGYDLFHASAHRHTGRHPAFAYFAGLPIAAGLSPMALPVWLQAGGQDLFDDLAGELGEKCLLVGHSGQGSRLWSNAPISTSDDLVGRPIAAVGLGRDIVRGLGGIAVDVDAPRLAASLASGQTWAAEWCGLMAGCAVGLDRASTCLSPSAFNPQGEALALSITRAVWDSMPAGDQAVLEAVAAAGFFASLAEAESVEQAVASVLVQRGNNPVAPLAEELSSAIARLADAVVADIASRDAISWRINASYMAFSRRSTNGAASADHPVG